MPSILNATTTNGLVTSADNSGSLQLQTNNGTTAVTIDTSQNVLVGTTTALYNSSGRGLIELNGSSNSLLALKRNNTSDFYIHNNSGSVDIYNNANTPMTFATNGSERMRITSGGDLLVGTTSSSGKLSVNGNAYIDSYLGVGTTPISNSMITISVPLNVPRSGIRIQTVQSPASGSFIEFLNLSGNVAGSITHTGTTTVAYNTSSDYRLKENIAPMTGALAKVQALKPCTYTWKEDGTSGEGFLAHELQEVCPQAVTFEKDAVDADGNPKYQGVDTSFLVATLTAAIQELKAELDATKAEVQALKGVA